MSSVQSREVNLSCIWRLSPACEMEFQPLRSNPNPNYRTNLVLLHYDCVLEIRNQPIDLNDGDH